jgi:hypothetical protein
MPILARLFSITVTVIIERQSALFVSISLLLNLSVYALDLYALTEAQRQSYLLPCISLYLLRPVWPNNGPKISIKCYKSYIIIFTVRVLKTLGLNVYGGNNDSNALTHESIILKYFKLKLSTGQTF